MPESLSREAHRIARVLEGLIDALEQSVGIAFSILP